MARANSSEFDRKFKRVAGKLQALDDRLYAALVGTWRLLGAVQEAKQGVTEEAPLSTSGGDVPW